VAATSWSESYVVDPDYTHGYFLTDFLPFLKTLGVAI